MSISTITIGSRTITVVALPGAPGLRSIEWNYFDQVAKVRSAFTGQIQRQQWFGADLLAGTAILPPLTVAQADDWEAFLMQVRGSALAFQLADPLRPTIRGAGGIFGNRPLVDNTVSWANVAGSQMLGTKGWLANTTVLRRGDWITVQYRLYRVLDDVTSDGSGNATIPIWPSLREQPYSNGSNVNYANATGSATMTSSAPLNNYNNGVLWGVFALPSLPSDAVIQGIYPVLICSATHNLAYSYFSYGANLPLSPAVGVAFSHPSNPNSTTFSSTEFYGASIGTSLSLLPSQNIVTMLNQSLVESSMTDQIAVTGVGYAIYYTSATPYTDPTMPPPFAVPSGQGLAWSLPLQEIDTGVTNTGTSSGTPARDNGIIQVTGVSGLFALANNKRVSSADISRLSRMSFQFEEYR